MKIGIDLHGVLTDYPWLVKPVMALVVTQGHEVHVVTGPPKGEAFDELHQLGYREGIHYTHIHSVVDHLKATNRPIKQDDNGNWWSPDHIWDRSKAEICYMNDIDVLIDDSPAYEKYFEDEKVKTQYVLVSGLSAGKLHENLLTQFALSCSSCGRFIVSRINMKWHEGGDAAKDMAEVGWEYSRKMKGAVCPECITRDSEILNTPNPWETN